MSNKNEFVMYFVINNDLHMEKGKIASQISHATRIITDEIVRSGYENHPVSELYMTYMKWSYNPTTVVLKASEEQLRKIIKEIPEAKHFIDTGNTTKIADNSLTVVVLPPSDKFHDAVKEFKLV